MPRLGWYLRTLAVVSYQSSRSAAIAQCIPVEKLFVGFKKSTSSPAQATQSADDIRLGGAGPKVTLVSG